MPSSYSPQRSDAPSFDDLATIALNLVWSWNHWADEIWEEIDPELWELTQNPWLVLQTTSPERLHEVGADPKFQELLSRVIKAKHAREQFVRWFPSSHPSERLTVAYFSLEFMLAEGLPIYSGGLGNVAGDQLKAATDLGVPVVGVGLLYQQGYFRQHILADGRQEALYPFNDPGQLPIQQLRNRNGQWLRIAIDFPGGPLWLRTWEVQVGATKLYLLDSNDPANLPELRTITSELYGGGPELRIRQERVLAIGGWRMLRALGLDPDVCHLNEGHAAFVVLERARDYMQQKQQPFEVALAATRAGNIFTTHTPVAAGFDRFSADLIEKHFRTYAERDLKISVEALLALGRQNPSDQNEPFSMAYLALRGSGAVNGVSRLHGAVSRKIFQDLFPRWPEADVPIGYVTNGVHVPTWDSEQADELWTSACGKHRWRGNLEDIEASFRRVSNSDLWSMRSRSRKILVEYVRKRLARQLAGQGASKEEVSPAQTILNPDALTLGFARRFATYKRPDLLLHDPDRLLRILTNSSRPVQLILAGKAHPADVAGQRLIQRWIEFIRYTLARSQAVFLSDYDMQLTEHLVRGVDLWVNTPRRPWEASGTSGMKVLVNGGLNLSELDGWWAEAYSEQVGWAIGDAREHDSDPAWDGAEADELYRLLEEQIIPEFYTRDENGVPTAWTNRMRESMARLTPAFSANRTVIEYTEQHYVPSAARYRARSSDSSRIGRNLVEWRSSVQQHWDNLRFGNLATNKSGDQYSFEVQFYLGSGLDPDFVRVELYADSLDGNGVVRQTMTRGEPLKEDSNAYSYQTTVPATRPVEHFTPRAVPFHPDAILPLEEPRILWYR